MVKSALLAKTLTASLPGNPREIFARISDPENLPAWHSSFCRSLRRENGLLIAESPRGPVPMRFIRDDHSLVLDLLIEVKEGIELLCAIRLLPNGDGSEIIWTLVKPEGISDSVFHEQLRWAGSALHSLRKVKVAEVAPPPQTFPAREEDVSETGSESLQTPTTAEVSLLPVSGKKLFIGNLSYDWTDDQLRAHFTEAGVVTTAEVARFRGRGGRSRGFGFVDMASEAEAQAAIAKFHGALAGGRQLIVRLSKSQESRPARSIGSAPASVTAETAEPGNQRSARTPESRPRTERTRRGRLSGGAAADPVPPEPGVRIKRGTSPTKAVMKSFPGARPDQPNHSDRGNRRPRDLPWKPVPIWRIRATSRTTAVVRHPADADAEL